MSEEYDSVEQELLDVTGFKAKKSYKNRQEYLLSLVRAVDKLDTDTYKNLSPEATDWQNEAVSAVSDKREIQDFEAPEEEEEPDDDDAADDDAVDEEEEEEEEAVTDEADDNVDDEEAADEADEDETEEDEEVTESVVVEDDDEVEEVAPPPRRRLGTKPAPAPVKSEKAKKVVQKIIIKAKEEKSATDKPKRRPPQFDRNAPRDRYGLIVGSTSSAATKMLEEGVTMPEIKKRFGDNKYNLLGKLANDGHKVERFGAGLIKLTHKDDVAKPKGGRPAKAKSTAALKA